MSWVFPSLVYLLPGSARAGGGRRVYFRWVRGIDFAVAVLDLLCHIARRDQ